MSERKYPSIKAWVIGCSLSALVGVGCGFSLGVSKGVEWVNQGYDRGYANARVSWSQSSDVKQSQDRLTGAWPTIDIAELCKTINSGGTLLASQNDDLRHSGIDPDVLCKTVDLTK